MLRLAGSLPPPVASLLHCHLVQRQLTLFNASRISLKVVLRFVGVASAWTISLPPGARRAERVACYQRDPEIVSRDSRRPRRPSSLVRIVGFSTATDGTRQPDLVLRGPPRRDMPLLTRIQILRLFHAHLPIVSHQIHCCVSEPPCSAG